MNDIFAILPTYDTAASISAVTSAAFSSTGALIRSIGAAVVAAIVVWFLVGGWSWLWNTDWKSPVLRICRSSAAIVAAVCAFFFVASFQDQEYLDSLEGQIDLALGGDAEWRQDAFDSVRSGVSVSNSGLGGDVVELKNRTDVVLLAETIWDAAFESANAVPGLPFRMNEQLSPGPNPDAANVVFPAEVTVDNEWANDARRSILKYWRHQANEWASVQFPGVRVPFILIFFLFFGLILATLAVAAWKDIKV